MSPFGMRKIPFFPDEELHPTRGVQVTDTDWPESVESAERMDDGGSHGVWLDVCYAAILDLKAEVRKYRGLFQDADRYSRELEAEVARLKAMVEDLTTKDAEHYEAWKKDMAAWKADRERAEQVEAKLTNAEHMMTLQLEQIQKAEDEAARLKWMLDECLQVRWAERKRRAEQAEAEVARLKAEVRKYRGLFQDADRYSRDLEAEVARLREEGT